MEKQPPTESGRPGHDIPIWPEKPVYKPISVNGVLFALTSGGRVWAAPRDGKEGAEFVGCWMYPASPEELPTHREFNNLAKRISEDYPVNEIRGRMRHRNNRKKAQQRAGPELYSALMDAKRILDRHGLSDEEITETIREAIAKANRTPKHQE